MKKLLKRIILFLAGLVVLVVAGAVIFANVYDFNKFKPRIEEAALEATGLPFSIKGDIGVKFLPGPAVSLKDIHFGKEKAEVLAAEEVNASVSLLPLLEKKVEVGTVRIVKPQISIVRDKRGRYNFPTGKPSGKKVGEKTAAPAVLVGKIVLSHGDLDYLDKASKTEATLWDFNLKIKDLSFNQAAGEIFKALSFNGTFDAAGLTAQNYNVSDIDVRYRLQGGVLDINPVAMKLYDGQAKGSCIIDFTKKRPKINIVKDVKGIDFGKLTKEVKGKEIIKGKADIKAKLTMRGLSGNDIRRSITGDISMRGGDMVFYGADLDATLSKLEQSGEFNLFDVGSLFVLGPFGPLLTKSADMAEMAVGGVARGEENTIEKLVFDWDVKDGIATTRDTAFSTPQNRMAFQGQLDFVNERFLGLTAGVLDAQGCATFKQTIVGPFSKPTVKKEGIIKSILKPLTSLFGKAKEPVAPSRSECTPFYEGSVEHPTGG
jgi:uncharacterized protein involved in outer membrane biogenesis